ncbi:hypothetical protein BH09BAC1_BH09BAC1_19400 [soil metagenome]
MSLLTTALPLALLLMSATFAAPENYILNKDYLVTIHGTSNMHDWDETVETVTGKGNVTANSDGTFDLNTLQINMSVLSIKSDERVMTNKTVKALKGDDHPQITFTLSTPLKSIKAIANGTKVMAKGNLNIAGVTRAVELPVTISMPSPGKMVFEGSQSIKMTDYGIDPPTALLGVLKTGNEITLHFKTNFISTQ